MLIKILALTGPALLLVGAHSASAEDHTHHKSETQHHAGYVKPGAAVALSHDYDGKTALGAFETITATLTHIYEDGAISVSLLSPPELQVSAFSPLHNRPLYRGTSFELPIQFSGTTNGAYTISLETVYESSDGQQSRRVLSIPVNIGKAAFEKSSPAKSKASYTDSKSGVIGLTAIEVIE